jgi:2-methylcitrate dehydratase PrpD
MTVNIAVTERLADWLCSESHDRLPATVKDKTVDVIFDAVGCMVACSALPEVNAIVEFVVQQGGQHECTIIGRRATTAVVHAAMANGGMAHGDEVDPVHMTSAGGHVAAGPVPTALTVGEWLNSSGRDVMRAVALGYEVGGRLMTIFYRERDYVSRRFYHTAVAANLSSAVSAGVLLGLDRKAIQVAMCLATYQAAGPDNMTRDPVHMGKTFQVAAANRNGVTAALLARQGCYAPLDVLDGTHGLFDAYLGEPEAGAELLHDLGRYYSITDVMHKRYPAGSPNQAYLQGLFGLLEQNALAPEDIAAIEIQMPKRGVHRVPKTRHASIAASVVSATAVVDGKLDFYRLHDPAGVITPAVARMQEKIRFIPREDWTGMEHGRHAIVTITTSAGKKLEQEVWYQPMTRSELDQKFDGLVTPRLGAQRARELQALLRDIESASSVRPLMEKLRA